MVEKNRKVNYLLLLKKRKSQWKFVFSNGVSIPGSAMNWVIKDVSVFLSTLDSSLTLQTTDLCFTIKQLLSGLAPFFFFNLIYTLCVYLMILEFVIYNFSS